MRDGKGNKLSEAETAKVKSAEVKPGDASLNQVSVDPQPGQKPASDETKPPPASTVPTF